MSHLLNFTYTVIKLDVVSTSHTRESSTASQKATKLAQQPSIIIIYSCHLQYECQRFICHDKGRYTNFYLKYHPDSPIN